MQLVYSSTAIINLRKLDAKLRKRILKKMEWFLQQANPLQFAIPLRGTNLATHRFRIGDHRVLVSVIFLQDTILVVTIKPRSQVYNS